MGTLTVYLAILCEGFNGQYHLLMCNVPGCAPSLPEGKESPQDHAFVASLQLVSTPTTQGFMRLAGRLGLNLLCSAITVRATVEALLNVSGEKFWSVDLRHTMKFVDTIAQNFFVCANPAEPRSSLVVMQVEAPPNFPNINNQPMRSFYSTALALQNFPPHMYWAKQQIVLSIINRAEEACEKYLQQLEVLLANAFTRTE